MRVLGLMSGTSADGIDVALVRITGRGLATRARLENHCTIPYSAAVRRAVLRVANANQRATVSPAEISQLNFLLGELAADAVERACRRFGVSLKSIGLIGSHGQTVYHQGQPAPFAGRRLASTLQLGEPAVIAERTGIPVVADFRPRDMAAGGQGAPLVPFVDYLLYRHPRRGRVALNLGGIANITLIPAGARPEDVIAFDTGPANMVIDAVVERVTRGRLRYDAGGRLAARGHADERVLRQLLCHPFFFRRPPKSAGREQFGEAFVNDFLRRMGRARAEDKIRTATELTARSLALSLALAFTNFILPRAAIEEIIVGGGGARNRFLLRRLGELLPGQILVPSGGLGVNAKAKEAFAFAVLAYQTWHGETATLPSATGARRAVILGTISPGKKGQPPRASRI
ncbi:MAG: anhydro-N-acetylmuramic acid kinase [Candidatus Acidiferrales bacterium]